MPTPNHSEARSLAASLKGQFWALCFSHYIHLHSAPFFHQPVSATTSMPTTPNSSFLFYPHNSRPPSPNSSLPSLKYPLGCLPTFCLLTHQKLNFSSLAILPNWPNSITLHCRLIKTQSFNLSTLHATLAFYLTVTSLSMTRSPLFANPATGTSTTFGVSVLPLTSIP